MPRTRGLVDGSIGATGSATTGVSAGVDADTCGTNTGTQAQQTHRAQSSEHGSAAEPRVSSTQSSGMTLASSSVLCTEKAASQTARKSRTTLPPYHAPVRDGPKAGADSRSAAVPTTQLRAVIDHLATNTSPREGMPASEPWTHRIGLLRSVPCHGVIDPAGRSADCDVPRARLE
jgi:hypothetical protein